MSVDKNLFLYDLAVVAVMKCEGSYIKEWLDYHLLAGVDHFFIYDNESTDNQKEILQPYIDAGIVTYTFFPGSSPQFPAYNDAINRFRFLCRYMAIIDGDEFILPKSKPTIIEVVDEILADKPNIGGLGINWNFFGSSGHKTADYTKGVLERFTYRTPPDYETVIKNIVNPRRIRYFGSPHYMYFYEGFFAVSEAGDTLSIGQGFNTSPTNKKIVINHYVTKSFEEYMNKNKRGDSVYTIPVRNEEKFNKIDEASTIFDDEILKYRAARQSTLTPQKGGYGVDILHTLAPRKQINYTKIYSALIMNLAPIIPQNVSPNFFEGRMENFLTCRVLIEQLRKKVLNEKTANFFEEITLNAVYKTLMTRIEMADIKLLLSELPNILQLDYPIVKNICNACVQIISQIMLEMRKNVPGHNPALWDEYFHLEVKLRWLKAFYN